jgi:hypothetical protein
MKLKLSLVFIIALSALIFSCQKESSSNTAEKDKDAILSVRVWHGVKIMGTAPVSSTVSNTRLEASDDGDVMHAISGRYIVIHPNVVNGSVAGYVFGIKNAGAYYKIDYSKPINIGGRLANKHKKGSHHFGNKPMGDDYNDSLIVVQLPASLNVPDTFCIYYYAVDSEGNYSNTITSCVYVDKIGTDAAGAWIEGDWKITMDAYKEDGFPWEYDSTIFRPTTEVENKFCVTYNNPLFSSYDFKDSCESDSAIKSCSPVQIINTADIKKNNITFNSNGEYVSENKGYFSYGHKSDSTGCKVVYDYYNNDYSSTGAWAYNTSTNKMLIIYENFDSTNTVNGFEAEEYRVKKISNTHFLIYYDSEPDFLEWIRLEK